LDHGAWPTHTQAAGFIFYASVEQTAAPGKLKPLSLSAFSSIADGRKESRKIGERWLLHAEKLSYYGLSSRVSFGKMAIQNVNL